MLARWAAIILAAWWLFGTAGTVCAQLRLGGEARPQQAARPGLSVNADRVGTDALATTRNTFYYNIAGIGFGYERRAPQGMALFAEAAVLTLPFVGGITGSKQFANFYPNARIDLRWYYTNQPAGTPAADRYLAWALVYLYNPYGSAPTSVQGAEPEGSFTGNRWYGITGPAWGFVRHFERQGYVDLQLGMGLAATLDANAYFRFLPLPNIRVAVGIAR